MGSLNFTGIWDFHHSVGLVSYYLNQRPTFYNNNEIMTPNTLEAAMLRRSPQAPRVYTLGDYILPKDEDILDGIVELTQIF